MGEPADGLAKPPAAAAEGLVCPLAAAVGAAAVGLDPAPLAAGAVEPQPVTRTAARQSVGARSGPRYDRGRPPAFTESLRQPCRAVTQRTAGA